MSAKKLCPITVSLIAILFCVSARAQDAASAKAFLVNIYSHYKKDGKGVDFDGPRSALYFHSSLLALENADVKANGPDSAPAMDADPICGCQDWEGIWNLAIDVRIESPQRALANVIFYLAPSKGPIAVEPMKLKFTLVPEHGGWRIWDILDESDPKDPIALRKLLEDDLASLRQHPAPASH
jgi:hypothetical protein